MSGTRLSLASNGAYAVVGTSTEALAVTSPPALTIGSQTITANSLSQYIIGAQTLTPGGVITVSGTRIFLAQGGTDVVVGTSTEALGGSVVVVGGGGNGNGNGTSAGGEAFTGGAGDSRRRGRGLWMKGALLAMGVLVVVGWL